MTNKNMSKLAQKFFDELKNYQHITNFTVAHAELEKFSWLYKMSDEDEDFCNKELHNLFPT